MADGGPARGHDGVLRLGGVPLDAIVREPGVTTPAFIYDLDAIESNARSIVAALGDRGLCCYAIKANGAAPIVRKLVSVGCGVDVVSGGELRLALACGARPDTIVYSGVAKRDDEIDHALSVGVRAIHAESVEELERVLARALTAKIRHARVGIRVNPSVEAETHRNIATGHDEAKFGISRADLPRALDVIRDSDGCLELAGVSSHVGSMLLTTKPYVAAVEVLCGVVEEVLARGFSLRYVDAGGGYGVAYRDDQTAASGAAFVTAARETLDRAGLAEFPLVIEPGRSLVAPYGVLLSRVIQPKRSNAGGVARRWLLIDAGMNDLIRPALYQAHHRILAVRSDGSPAVPWRVAGPVCESSDDFGEHALPDPPPDLVAIREAGAYGRSMASTYNARPIAAEVFLAAGRIQSVRPSRGVEALVESELT
jgi:diaminopimelate decarboxylase